MKDAMTKVMRWWRAVAKDPIPSSPKLPSREQRDLSISLMKEELDELLTAISLHDMVEVADGGCDLIWVILEFMIKCGIDVGACFDEVARSNLLKVVDGKVLRREDGKILKPEGWTPPDIARILKEQESITDTYRLYI